MNEGSIYADKLRMEGVLLSFESTNHISILESNIPITIKNMNIQMVTEQFRSDQLLTFSRIDL